MEIRGLDSFLFFARDFEMGILRLFVIFITSRRFTILSLSIFAPFSVVFLALDTCQRNSPSPVVIFEFIIARRNKFRLV